MCARSVLTLLVTFIRFYHIEVWEWFWIGRIREKVRITWTRHHRHWMELFSECIQPNRSPFAKWQELGGMRTEQYKSKWNECQRTLGDDIKQKLLNCKSRSELIKLRVDCMAFFSLFLFYFHYFFNAALYFCCGMKEHIHCTSPFPSMFQKNISNHIWWHGHVSYTLISQICLFFLPLTLRMALLLRVRSSHRVQDTHSRRVTQTLCTVWIPVTGKRIIVCVHSIHIHRYYTKLCVLISFQ